MNARLKILCAAILFFGLWVMLKEHVCVRINASESLPQVYWVGLKKITVQKGSHVLIQKPQMRVTLLKQVTGVAGDRISRHGATLFVNEKPLCVLQEQSGLEQALIPLPDQIIPRGYVFVSTPHDRGIDSRYKNLGLIALDHIKAVMWPLPFSKRGSD